MIRSRARKINREGTRTDAKGYLFLRSSLFWQSTQRTA
jgi:hypothetical protein